MFWLIDTVIVRPIVNILFLLYQFVGDFGIAVILLTIIVKFLMWPLIKRQLHQQKLMKKIRPELAEIKKRANGNRQLESLEMMNLYKKHNVKPFRSFLITLIQLPIYLSLFMAINSIVRPVTAEPGATCGYTNVSNCAYAPVKSLDRISSLIELQTNYFESTDENKTYEYKPTLFNTVDLSARAGWSNISSLIILGFAILSAFLQYFIAKQQMPADKGKAKSFRQLMQEAADGKEPDQADITAMTTRQTVYMMPFMMLFIMTNLPGALVLYYLISNSITLVQQKLIFRKDYAEMEDRAADDVTRELNRIQEAKIVEKGKSGTKITRIKASDSKSDKRKGGSIRKQEKK